jgi:hypothetical protein
VSDQGLTFPDFFTMGPLFQPSLIFPVPCEFISADLPHCFNPGVLLRPGFDPIRSDPRFQTCCGVLGFPIELGN